MVRHFETRAAERAEKERKILLAAQLNKEAALLQEKKQLHFGYADRQVNLVKTASSAAHKPRVVQNKELKPIKPDSRKRKAEQPAASEDILLLKVEKDDYCEPQPSTSTSRLALFGSDTPPSTPSKLDLNESRQRHSVDDQPRRKSRRDKASSPQKVKSSRHRANKRKNKPNPYVKLTKLNLDQLATTLKPRSTTGEAAAESRDKTAERAALASPKARGLTSSLGTPEPYGKRAKTRRVAHTPRFLSLSVFETVYDSSVDPLNKNRVPVLKNCVPQYFELYQKAISCTN